MLTRCPHCQRLIYPKGVCPICQGEICGVCLTKTRFPLDYCARHLRKQRVYLRWKKKRDAERICQNCYNNLSALERRDYLPISRPKYPCPVHRVDVVPKTQ
jgi:hypothetical protein